MKMTKSILVAVAALAAFSFAGCKKTVGDLKINVAGDNASIDFENTTDGILRGFQETNLKHSGCTVEIVQKNQTASSCDGMMGVIFNETKNEDGTINFYIVGIQNYNGKGRYYISKYTNIAKDSLSADNFGVGTGDAKEVEIVKLPKTANLPTLTPDKDGDFKATIQIAPDYEGNVTVNIFATSDTLKFTQNETTKLYEANIASVASKKIEGVYTAGPLVTENKPDTIPQGYLAWYANVYSGATLTGTWKCTTKLNEAVEE